MRKIILTLCTFVALSAQPVLAENKVDSGVQKCIEEIKSATTLYAYLERTPSLWPSLAAGAGGALMGPGFAQDIDKNRRAKFVDRLTNRLGKIVGENLAAGPSETLKKMMAEVERSNKVAPPSLRGRILASYQMSTTLEGFSVGQQSKTPTNLEKAKVGLKGGAVGLATGLVLPPLTSLIIGKKCGKSWDTKNGDILWRYFGASATKDCQFLPGGIEKLLAEDEGRLVELCEKNPRLPETIAQMQQSLIDLVSKKAPPQLESIDCSTNELKLGSSGRIRSLHFERQPDGNMKVKGAESPSTFSAVYDRQSNSWKNLESLPKIEGQRASNPRKSSLGNLLIAEFISNGEADRSTRMNIGEQLYGFQALSNVVDAACPATVSAPPLEKIEGDAVR